MNRKGCDMQFLHALFILDNNHSTGWIYIYSLKDQNSYRICFSLSRNNVLMRTGVRELS